VTPEIHATPSAPRPGLGARARAWLAGVDAGRWLYVPVIAVCALVVVWQIASLGEPIHGEHNWRQADTYSVAYNLVHGQADLLHPQIDWTHGRSGIMGMEAPIYPWLAHLGMLAFGDDPAVARVVAWLLFAGAVFAFARGLRAGRSSIAIGVVVMAALSPMALFEFRQIQPDAPSVALCMMAAACCHLFARHERRRWLVAGLVLYTLAILTKPQAMVAGPAMWLFTWTARPPGLKRIALRGALFAIPLAALFVWMKWAAHLDQAYNEGQVYFAMGLDAKSMLADMTNGGLLEHVFAFLTTTYVTSWVLFPAVLVGLVAAFDRPTRAVAIPMLVWLLCAVLFLAAVSSRLASHWYYGLAILPPVLWFGAVGLARFFDMATAEAPSPRTRWAGLFLAATLALAPLVGGRLRELAEVPAATGYTPRGTWVGLLGLIALLVLFMASYAVAHGREPARHRRWLWLAVVAVASGLGLWRAAHDTIQNFKWRSREMDWATSGERWASLREAVDAVSTRADPFVVDGANPWYLYLPLRQGWTEPQQVIDQRGLPYFTERGARFLVHYDETGSAPFSVRKRKPIAEGPGWHLYCLADDDCPPRAPEVL